MTENKSTLGPNTRISLIAAVMILVGALVGAGVVGALFLTYNEEIRISTGELTQTQSDLVIEDVDLEGPGNNVETVTLTIDNPTADLITADVTVSLVDQDGTLVTEATEQAVDFPAEDTSTLTLQVDRTNRNDFADTDVLIEEL